MSASCNFQPRRLPIILFLILWGLLQINTVECSSQFPKILWVFWDSGFEKSPIPVQLSLKSMKDKLSGTGWEVREVSNDNLHLYLNEEDQKEMVRQSSIDWVPSDQIRLTLLIKYGGVYIDSSCFLLQDFTWIENIKENTDIVNKYGQYPDVLMFYNTYQSSFQYREYQDNIFLVSPGVENWFIAAMPNSTFLKLWLNQVRVFMIEGKDYIEQELESNNIRTGAIASDPTNKNHYFSNYEAFHYVIQMRQRQIDKEIQERSNTDKANEDQNAIAPLAVQQYGLWFIPAVKGPFKMMLKNNINFEKRGIQMLTEFTQEQLTQKYGRYKYFIKITGSVRKIVNKMLQDQSSVKFSQSWSFSGRYSCLNNFYFAKNSIFEQYFLRYMSPEQMAKINIVDKQDLPFLCQESDIEYLVLWFQTIILAPVLLFIFVYAGKLARQKYTAKKNLLLQSYSSYRKNQNNEDEKKQTSALDIQKCKALRYIKNLKIIRMFQLAFALIIFTIFLGSLILQLIGWYYQLLSNLAGLLPLQFFVLGWLTYSTISILKKQSNLKKNLLRGGTLLVMITFAYLVCKFNSTFDDNLNQDTNNFYLYGVTVGLIGVSIVYWWVLVGIVSLETLIKEKRSNLIIKDSNSQPSAKNPHLEMSELVSQN